MRKERRIFCDAHQYARDTLNFKIGVEATKSLDSPASSREAENWGRMEGGGHPLTTVKSSLSDVLIRGVEVAEGREDFGGTMFAVHDGAAGGLIGFARRSFGVPL